MSASMLENRLFWKWKQKMDTRKDNMESGWDRVKIITLQNVREIHEAALIISMKKNQAVNKRKRANRNILQK